MTSVDGLSVLRLAGLGAASTLAILVWRLSRNARVRRRLRKSHGHVIAKSSRPMVKFSVRTPKK
jgi:hypothetical protein